MAGLLDGDPLLDGGVDVFEQRPRQGGRRDSPGEMLEAEGTRPGRGPKPTLTVCAIAQAAIELADAQGLDAVSMERVAGAFGFTTMSLYRYVPGKRALIALMISASADASCTDAPRGRRATTLVPI